MKFVELIDMVSNLLTLDVEVEVDPFHREHLFKACVWTMANLEDEAFYSAYNLEVKWIKATFEWDDINRECMPVLCVTLKK